MSSAATAQQTQDWLLQHQNSRERNLRKLRLQLLFGPGLICVCGPPASGKTNLVAQILGVNNANGGGGGTNTSSGNNNKNNNQSDDDEDTIIDDEVAEITSTKPVLRETVVRRRQREVQRNSSESISTANTSDKNWTNNPFLNSLLYANPKRMNSNGSTVVAYISAASASSASHAIRRLGKEARRSVRMWSDPPNIISNGDSISLLASRNGTVNNTNRGNNPNLCYSATESKSLEGAVAAASLDIKVAYEEMMAVVAVRNKQQGNNNSASSGGNHNNNNLNNNSSSINDRRSGLGGQSSNVLSSASLLHQRSHTFGAGDEIMEPPVLHLVIDDVDLIELQQRTSSSKNAFGRGGGKSDDHLDTSQQSGNVATGNWDSFDQAIESLFKNVSLSNYPARGKRLYDSKKHSATIVTPANSSTYDLCTSAPILSVPESLAKSQSTTPSRAVAVRISSGIYIWVITQTPFESRCLYERTCFFAMPAPHEIAKDAAKMARTSLLQVRGMKTASLVSSTVVVASSAANSAASPPNNSANASSSSSNAANINNNQRSEDDTFYELEQLQTAATYYCTHAPTCHSLVVRDARLLAARLVAIVQYLQRTRGAGGKALPRLTPPVLARAWSSAASIEEQLGAARRDADRSSFAAAASLLNNQQNNENNGTDEDGNNANNNKSKKNATTVNQHQQQQQQRKEVSSALVASMRCLPVAAQLLALAAFCCGALSEATLKAVLGDTTGFIRQVRGGAGSEGGRGSRMANSNFNNSHSFMMKYVFGPSTLAWTYDAIVRVATSIQQAKQPQLGNNSRDSLKIKTNNNTENGSNNKTHQADKNHQQLTLGSCCWTPGKLSNCLPTGYLAQHHLLSLEALGAVSTVRGTATTKYRCSLMPNDAASLAKAFDIDIWQLTSGASVRSS